MVVMAPLYCSAVSRSTRVGITDVERFSTVLAFVSWIWKEEQGSRERVRTRPTRDIEEEGRRGLERERDKDSGRQRERIYTLNWCNSA